MFRSVMHWGLLVVWGVSLTGCGGRNTDPNNGGKGQAPEQVQQMQQESFNKMMENSKNMPPQQREMMKKKMEMMQKSMQQQQGGAKQ